MWYMCVYTPVVTSVVRVPFVIENPILRVAGVSVAHLCVKRENWVAVNSPENSSRHSFCRLSGNAKIVAGVTSYKRKSSASLQQP